MAAADRDTVTGEYPSRSPSIPPGHHLQPLLAPAVSGEGEPGASDAQQVDLGDSQCGVWGFEPACLQRLASKKAYVLVNGLVGLNMTALGAYYVATISTIERRYHIPSQTTGLISSAFDMGVCLSLLTLGYVGSRGHMPRYITAGTLLSAMACLLSVVPHVWFGPGQGALDLTSEYGSGKGEWEEEGGLGNATYDASLSLCPDDGVHGDDCSSGASSVPSLLLFTSQWLMGVGDAMFIVLGTAYLDDNTRKNKAAMVLAVSQSIRMLGPTLGFSLGSYALAQYVEPGLHPVVGTDDPRWLGAWWLGWLPLAAMGFVLAGLVSLFPRQLPRTAMRRAQQGHSRTPTHTSLADFWATFVRMLTNRVLMLNTLSGVCFMLGYTGYWTFMPKYIETQYRQSAATASFISGSIGLVFTALGVLTSAVVITRFRPRPRSLAAWNVLVECVDVVGHLSWAFLTCPVEDLHGSMATDGSWELTAECNVHCRCAPWMRYSPVCSSDGTTTFYSACTAGCQQSQDVDGFRTYSNCSCIPGGVATAGACPVDCTGYFTTFLVTQCVMMFLGATGKAGNTLIQIRCVDEKDKSLSIALGIFLIALLAFIPGPVLYGWLLDSACRVWGHSCGERGNCWLYDGRTLGFLLNFTAAGCLLCGMLLDVGVCRNVGGLTIYDEDTAGREGRPGESLGMKHVLAQL